MRTRDLNKIQNLAHDPFCLPLSTVPLGVTYEKIGTIQRRLAWPLHKDDTLSRSGRSTDLNIYFYASLQFSYCRPVHFVYALMLSLQDVIVFYFVYNA
ncbi:hypothetical protein PILCRDRAFT_57052 [Piloderma croceum F 1598]|uniref:Uncharacterized protein n=1 Tax=Piloderma croceum (strain F 1598) TaxID=765440 RepID=A0A0C3BZY1_PILCF|nr:hypothetical protein PILCRDRAFT_57052 [Piloderma croceum F 1598]